MSDAHSAAKEEVSTTGCMSAKHQKKKVKMPHVISQHQQHKKNDSRKGLLGETNGEL